MDELTEAERESLRQSVYDLPPDDGNPWLFAVVARIKADAHAAGVAEGRAEAVAAVGDYVRLVERIHQVYRHLVMDTPEDRRLHAKHIETADKALALVRAALAGASPQGEGCRIVSGVCARHTDNNPACICHTRPHDFRDDATAIGDSTGWGGPVPPEPMECCASGRCEVCTPGFDWGRDG